jgi:phage terminase large subunit-like protein
MDESYNLRETEVSALVVPQLSSPNNQTIYASTAGVFEQQPNCQVLSDMRRLGQQKQQDLYYVEFCAEDGMPLGDPATWAYANPSYGLLAKPRDIARLQIHRR